MATDQPTSHRQVTRPVDPDIVRRWSPRAFDASPIEEDLLLTVLEAARWAPSAYNAQPWRFVYELRDGPRWDAFVSVLLPFNGAWAMNASALVFVLLDSLMAMPGKDPVVNANASFDVGSAWGLLALQATKLGLHTHAMAGLDHARAAETLGFDDRYQVVAGIAIGRVGAPEQLSESLRAREVASHRRSIEGIASRGHFADALREP
jgi:nitroreductase